jgi:hypothetical protein
MKKILLLTSLVLGFVMQVNAACYLLTVRNITGCTLYYSGFTYTPPTCSPMNNTNAIMIPPGATQSICVGDPTYSWSPLVPNGVTDRWGAIKVFTDPTSGCPVTGTAVGEATCGLPATSSFATSTVAGCPYAPCPTVTVTWSFTPPFHWLVVLS